MAKVNNRNLFKKFTLAEQAILTTLLYSDIFSFPLTKDELWRFLIAEKKISRSAFDSSLLSLRKQINVKEGYYCLPGREETISRRKKNLLFVEKKMQRALFVAEKLASIPSILFIGVSGGLAVGNATEKDDIDFVIITKENALFTTRLWILIILEGLGVRRHRNQKKTADTICVNLLFDETALAWPKDLHDLYSAREIAQILPLFERNKLYQQFFFANSWIKHFLPNILPQKVVITKVPYSILTQVGYTIFGNTFVEFFSRVLQRNWMKRHQTRETITKHVLAFHPNDYRTQTFSQMRLKARQLGLLTKF